MIEEYFENAVMRIWSMDAGLRARTKQFIEFGLKISCNPCLYIKEYQQEILYRTLAFEQLCSTVQKYSSLISATNNTQR